MSQPRDVWYHAVTAGASAQCEPEAMNAEDPLFILHTSGSTGKPKERAAHDRRLSWSIVSMTHEYIFDYHDGDVYWCTADVGWVTGHSYIVYGPLSNGAITLMFRRRPQLSGHVALLAGDRQAWREHLLYRADCHPRPDARRRRPGEADFSRQPAAVGIGGRADQSGSLDLVSPRRRRQPLPGG